MRIIASMDFRLTKVPKPKAPSNMATTGRSTNVSLTPYMQRRGQQSRSKGSVLLCILRVEDLFEGFRNGIRQWLDGSSLQARLDPEDRVVGNLQAKHCGSEMLPAKAAACVLANLCRASRSFYACCSREIPTAVGGLGDCSRRVSLWHIPCLRHHPVKQAEIPCPHGEMGKLLPLQPLLKSPHHRAGLRTIRRALLLEGNR